MELQQLRYVVAVAEAGSFTKAAEQCGVTQPSLSQQIQKLEQELGAPLFDRLPRRVVLTEAGRTLAGRARTVLAGVEDARREVAESSGSSCGRLIVGAIPTVAPFVAPPAIRELRRRMPQLALRIEENVTAELLRGLLAGEIDVAIASAPIEHEHLHVEPLFVEPLRLALATDHPLARKRKVKWSDLHEESLLVLHDVHCLGQQVGAFCQQNDVASVIAFRGAQIATLLAMVELGLGISLIPDMAARADTSKKRVYRDLAGDLPTRTIVAVWNLLRYRTNAARALVEAVGEGWRP